jgi:pimeloyl-ACP methyl ester carboxylesterase
MKALPDFINSKNSDSAVIFIHGLGGSYWTWKKFSNHLSNTWEESSSFGLEYDEYYQDGGFLNKIPIIKYLLKIRQIIIGPSIEVLSTHLKTAIDEKCDEYENVIIIAHSMGGLVARKYILNLIADTKSLGKIKGLITYATPHYGSKWANYYLLLCYYIIRIFSRDSQQISQISTTGEFINELNKKWSAYNIDDKIAFYRVYGLMDWVVNAESSSYIMDSYAKPVANKGHFNIIKPRRKKDTAFMVTYNYLKRFRDILEIGKELAEDEENDTNEEIDLQDNI